MRKLTFAQATLEAMAEEMKKDDKVYVIGEDIARQGGVFGQFKELFIVNYLRWTARHKGMPFPSDAELMRILKKNNVYVLGEIKQNAANWDNRRVFNILGLLREYDAKSKGMNAGGASDGELLRELLLKIFLL